MPKINDAPQIIKEVGFDFDWDVRKLWVLDEPVTWISIDQLTWHFDIPFLWEGGQIYNLTPREVIENPGMHDKEYSRTKNADLNYPIDVMENKGRLLILDGLHRLMRAHMEGQQKVQVQIIPRSRIPEITTE